MCLFVAVGGTWTSLPLKLHSPPPSPLPPLFPILRELGEISSTNWFSSSVTSSTNHTFLNGAQQRNCQVKVGCNYLFPAIQVREVCGHVRGTWAGHTRSSSCDLFLWPIASLSLINLPPHTLIFHYALSDIFLLFFSFLSFFSLFFSSFSYLTIFFIIFLFPFFYLICVVAFLFFFLSLSFLFFPYSPFLSVFLSFFLFFNLSSTFS